MGFLLVGYSYNIRKRMWESIKHKENLININNRKKGDKTMKRFINEQIKPENYSHIQMLPGGIYRVMIKTTEEVDENCMIMVATAKYTHRPTAEEISEDYQWHTETLDKMMLEQAKLAKTREITEYNSSENVDGFYLNGVKHWLTLDERKAAELSTKAHITLGHETTEQCMGGVFYTIPCESLIYMLAELEIYALECLNHAKRQEAEVMTITDIEAVEKYDVTKGYPEMLRFEL